MSKFQSSLPRRAYDLVVRAFVEFGGAGTLMTPEHSQQGAATGEIGGDARGAEGVIADRRRNTGVQRLALQHAPSVGLGLREIRQNPGASVGDAETTAARDSPARLAVSM